MVDIGVGHFDDDGFVLDERKLIRFPHVTEGRLADAIAHLRAPGTAKELRSEQEFRKMYRAAAVSWPAPRTHGTRASVLVGVAALTSVFATATGLSAASVLPAPASHVVNHVLNSLGGTDGSSGSPIAGSTTPVSGVPEGTPTSVTAGSAAPGTSGPAGTNAACRRGRASCTLHHAHTVVAGGATSASAGANRAVHSPGGTTNGDGGTGSNTTSTPPTSATSTSGGTTSTPGTGSSPATGSSSGTGVDRGGNTGVGNTGKGKTGKGKTGAGKGSGSSSGGGDNRGGNLGGSSTGDGGRGRKGGHHGGGSGSSPGTAATGTQSTGTGSSGRRHHKGSVTGGTASSGSVSTTTDTDTTTPLTTNTNDPAGA